MRRTLAHIQANLGLWDQNKWVGRTDCGTTYCYAGWTVVLEGIPITVNDVGIAYVRLEDVPEPWMVPVRERGIDYLDHQAFGRGRITISDMAAVILDLSGEGRNPNEHWALFGACARIPALRDAIDRICAGKDPLGGGVYRRVRERSEDTQEAAGPGVDGTGTVSDAE